MLSPSLALQSTQPIDADRQPAYIHATSSADDRILCMVATLQSSGSPGSSRDTRYSSVTARPSSFLSALLGSGCANTDSGMWLPSDLLIFFLPSRPSSLGRLVSSGS